MTKRPRSSTRSINELHAQANATRNLAETLADGPIKTLVLEGAATLDSVARGRKKTAEPGAILELPRSAPSAVVHEIRKRRSVKYGQDVYLPSWREAHVGLPCLLLRSALFAAVNPGEVFVEKEIPAQGKVQLFMTGPQLCDYDRRLFSVCLKHYADSRPLSQDDTHWVRTTFWQLAQAMQVSYNANVHKAIRSSLNRLNAALLRIKVGRTDLPVPRLVDVAFDDGYEGPNTEDANLKGSDQVAFRVQESMAALFGASEWSLLSDLALHGIEGMAAWLVGFYSTHSRPFELELKDLYAYSGSTCEMYEFRRRLKTALTKLQDERFPDDFRVSRFDLTKKTLVVGLVRWSGRNLDIAPVPQLHHSDSPLSC
jgi:hypothetical protein